MPKIEIPGDHEQLHRISIFLTNNNIKHEIKEEAVVKENSEKITGNKNSWMDD